MRRLPMLLAVCLIACRSAHAGAAGGLPSSDLAAADRLGREGFELFQNGDLPPAIDKLTAALELWHRAGNEAAEANATEMLALLYQKTGNAQQALAFGARAQEIFHRQGDRRSEAGMLLLVGSLQVGQAAYDTLSAALPLLPPGDVRLAHLLQLRGLAASELHRDEDALADLARAGGLFHQLNDLLQEAMCLMVEAEVQTHQLALEKSLASYEAALALFEQSNEKNQAAITLRGIGFTAEDLGQPLKALASFQRELALWEELEDRPRQAQALGDLGVLQASLGELQDALRCFTRASVLAREVHDAKVEAQILLQDAEIQARLDDWNQALVVARRALEIFHSLLDRRGEARALTDIGTFQSRQAAFHPRRNDLHSVFRAAAESLEKALQSWRDLGDEEEESQALSRLGDIYQVSGERQKLAGLLGRARELATKVDSHSRPDLLELIGWALLTETDAGQASEVLTEALALASALGHTTAEARILAHLGFCSEIDKDLPRALEFYLRSIGLQETLQAGPPLDFLKTGIAAAAADAYERAVLVSLRLGRTAQAFEIAERFRARELRATLAGLHVEGKSAESAEWIRRERELRVALTELEQHAVDAPDDSHAGDRLAARRTEYNEVLAHLRDVDPKSAELLQPRPVSLAEVQRRLDDRTVLLSYFVTSERTLAFVVTRSSLEAVELPVTKDELEQAAGVLKSGAPADYASLSRSLIAPVAGKLRAPVVAIVPHAMLSYVPFAALRDGRRYFGVAHTLFQLPAAALLPTEPRRARPAAQLSPLVMAYSPSGKAPGQLPEVNLEARSIARLFGVAPVLGADATPAAFLARVRGHGLVHLAAHAELESANPLVSRILLAPGGSSKDGSLYLHQIYGLDLPGTELVVLSACQTAAGNESRGDDVVALNRGFLHAGAAAVLASLWEAGDKATRPLMEAFYRHLKNGEGKAEALQAAQAETRKRFPRPVDWAGFVLTGDPGPIVGRPAE